MTQRTVTVESIRYHTLQRIKAPIDRLAKWHGRPQNSIGRSKVNAEPLIVVRPTKERVLLLQSCQRAHGRRRIYEQTGPAKEALQANRLQT
jgi:hypothetical protein